jgi:carboxyl-terminal processing protease
VSKNQPLIEKTATTEAFERAITLLLQNLKTSHIGFFHQSARRASSRAALSATYLEGHTVGGSRWIFQDVHDGGAAAQAGIRPGDVLLAVDGKEIIPPDHPVFPMGESSEVTLVGSDDQTRAARVQVAKPRGKKLQFVQPTLVQSKTLKADIGYLKVTMFPGVVGVEVANEISKSIASLGAIKGLVIDLRGNTGGGAGALRLMSLLTPDRVPVGFAPDKRWVGRDLMSHKVGFPRFGTIPATKGGLWLQALKFLPALVRRSPIVLQSEGHGVQPYHGNIVVLVDRHTASAAEMVTVFAQENRFATVVGERTAGRLLSATSVKVGHGFRLALPTGAYYTWNGTVLEGKPIEPDILSEFDWKERRRGHDQQLDLAVATVNSALRQ